HIIVLVVRFVLDNRVRRDHFGDNLFIVVLVVRVLGGHGRTALDGSDFVFFLVVFVVLIIIVLVVHGRAGGLGQSPSGLSGGRFRAGHVFGRSLFRGLGAAG